MSLSQCLDKSTSGLNIVCDKLTCKTLIAPNIPSAGVQSLNLVSGVVALTSPAGSITIVPNGQSIQLEAVGQAPVDAVDSLNGLINDVVLTSTNNSLTVANDGQNINIELNPFPYVSSFNSESGAISLFSETGTISILQSGGSCQLDVNPSNFVRTVNGVGSTLSLTSPNGSLSITPVGQDIQIESVAVSPFDVEGLQNKIGVFPTLPFTSNTIQLASNNDLTPPTAIVPDATAPTSSTTPLGTLCWLYTKPNTNAGFNWYMYNPRFGNPTAPLPYTKYSSNPAQDRVKSVWALVQPAVNTNIYTAGVIALNLYSFDDANPPTSGFFNTRWAYSNSAGINSGQSGTNLYAGYTYLLYAYDAPRTTNQTGVGQPDIQDWGLRDPYDIYTDVHHIPLQNCVLAFNPWTNGTNYRTWDTLTIYTNGQTVIYSGFGGTPNGIFYTAVGTVPVNTPPVSTTGVPSAFWTAISPQPSSYASQPILAMNLTGINGTATGWTAGPLLRVLSMGYSTGNSPLIQTSGIKYELN